MSNDFEPGTVVQLKSGGGSMTVGEVIDANNVRCHWWHPNEYVIKAEVVPTAALQIYQRRK